MSDKVVRLSDIEEMLANAQIVSDGEYNGYCTEDVNLSMLPTADVAPVVHAHWERKAYFPDGTPAWVCSRCGRAEEEREPYCNCGAKMDEEIEEDVEIH